MNYARFSRIFPGGEARSTVEVPAVPVHCGSPFPSFPRFSTTACPIHKAALLAAHCSPPISTTLCQSIRNPAIRSVVGPARAPPTVSNTGQRPLQPMPTPYPCTYTTYRWQGHLVRQLPCSTLLTSRPYYWHVADGHLPTAKDWEEHGQGSITARHHRSADLSDYIPTLHYRETE